MPGITTWQHPRFFGYFPSNAAAVERARRLRQHRPWRDRARVAVEPGAHRSRRGHDRLDAPDARPVRRVERRDQRHRVNEHAGRAAVRARARVRITAWRAAACRQEAQPLVVYTSAHSHSSVEKAALLAGFGKAHVRIVPHDGSYAMRPESLEEMVKDDILNGRRPCAVVATTGTTTSTALDPLEAIARRREGPRPVAARRCRHGRLGDDPARSAAGCGTASSAPTR